jgi:hypothetical protein
MRHRRPQVKNERRPVVDSGSVVQRGSGPVISRGPLRRGTIGGDSIGGGVRGGPIRRGGGAGVIRFMIFLALIGVAYYAVGAYREKIVEALPQAYPVLKAIGLDVQEPAGYGLTIESRADRVQDENRQWVVYVRGRITNKLDKRTSVPRLQITVTSRNAQPLVWTVQPEMTSLAPGQQTAFQSRYSTPFALIDMRAQVKVLRQ